MSLDEKTLNKIKKEIRKGDDTLPDILKKLPELFDTPKKFERKPKLSPEQREELKKYGEKFLDKFKEKKKIIPIPKEDFKGKRFNPDKIPLDPRGEPFKLPERFKPGERGNKKSLDKMPYIIKPGEEPRFGVQLLKEGGEVKRYKAGGSVKKNKSNMITTKGWGASRKT